MAENERHQELTMPWKSTKVFLVSPRKSTISDLQEAMAENERHQDL